MKFAEMTQDQLKEEYEKLTKKYDEFCAKELDLNMARGKPGADQLELSMPMLDVINSATELVAEDGSDCRNYGVLTGLPEAREFMAQMMEVKPQQVIVFGNSSLNVMYDTIARAITNGILGNTPWGEQDVIKFLCPVPGYDRHFAICEHFGIEMIQIPMTPQGPDMDMVEELVAKDSRIKGIWCVPKYSNPTGYSYSDETVKRFAALKPAAEDFRIFWDNAYCVHHLYAEEEKQDKILNILDECEKCGNPNMAYVFASTSKITFPGSGISAMAASEENIASIVKMMGAQTIGHDKINQLRHVRFLKDAQGLADHMQKHAECIRPKFEAVLEILDEDLTEVGIGSWTKPRGGYFICFEGPQNSAKAIVAKAADAGVKLTGAGAPFPKKQDANDAVIRIAPTYPSLEDLKLATRIFTLCVRIVALEQLMDA